MDNKQPKTFTSFRQKRKLDTEIEKPPTKRRINKKLVAVVLSLGVLFLIIVFLVFSNSATSVVNFVTQHTQSEPENPVTNVLLLGLAGGKHDGALLTDSIIVASFNKQTQRALLISIPRDLWLKSINQKVNAAYEYGLMLKNGGNGLKFAEDKIDDLLGIPISYGVRIDFSGFEQAIDTVGGVDVEVEKTFDDYNYPITGKEDEMCGITEQTVTLDEAKAKELNLPVGEQKVWLGTDGKQYAETDDFVFPCRYEHLHFDKGLVHLDGEMALKFVRSRHGTNGEGSDFARSKRQQLVIEAFKQKALSLDTLANPQKAFSLLDSFNKSVETDIPKDRFLDFYSKVKNAKSVDSIVLGDLGNGKSLLIQPPVGEYGAFTLAPPNYDFSQIQSFVRLAVEATDSASLQQITVDATTKPAATTSAKLR